MWSPYWEHVKEGWEHRDEPNVLFLFYENFIKVQNIYSIYLTWTRSINRLISLSQDLPGNILKISKFLNKPVNDANLRRLVEHLKIDNFRNNDSVNLRSVVESGFGNANGSSFIRSGKVTADEWPAEYTPEVAARAEKWFQKNLRETTLMFPKWINLSFHIAVFAIKFLIENIWQ